MLSRMLHFSVRAECGKTHSTGLRWREGCMEQEDGHSLAHGTGVASSRKFDARAAIVFIPPQSCSSCGRAPKRSRLRLRRAWPGKHDLQVHLMVMPLQYLFKAVVRRVVRRMQQLGAAQ